MNRAAVLLTISLIGIGSLILFAFGFLDFVALMGRNIPQTDMGTDYVIGATWAMFIGLTIPFWPLPGQDRRLMLHGWLAKSVMTLMLMLPYEYTYGLDAYNYYYDPTQNNFLRAWPTLGQGNETVFALSWLHHQVFPNSYHMMKVSFALVGLLSIYIFYRAGVRFLGKEEPKFFYALALYPSITFWSSIIGKDPVIMLGIALYVSGVVGFYKSGGIQNIILIAIGIVGSMYVRIWMGSIMLAPLCIFALFRMRNLLIRFALVAVVILALGNSINRFKDSFKLQTTEDVIAKTQFYATNFAGESQSKVGEAELGSIGQIIAFMPLGIFTALFRPLPGELLSAFALMASLENAVLLVLLYQAIRRSRKKDWLDPMILWAVGFVLVWAAIYGVTAIQNLGAAVRFRLQVLPVMLGVILYLRNVSPQRAAK